MERLTWECFLNDIRTIYNLSLKFNDDWQMIIGNDEIGGTYLVKNQTVALKLSEKSNDSSLNENEEKFTDFLDQYGTETGCESSDNCSQHQLIKFEYHVLYHISYAVPYLCFNAYKSNGTLLTLDNAWELFKDHMSHHNGNANHQLNMLNILTQMEHPILFKPFLTLHPCRIAEVLCQLPNSQNKVLSFLSIYGPSIFLTLDLDYAKYFNQLEDNKEI